MRQDTYQNFIAFIRRCTAIVFNDGPQARRKKNGHANSILHFHESRYAVKQYFAFKREGVCSQTLRQ